jgi:type IV pilus assembly protein PilQ
LRHTGNVIKVDARIAMEGDTLMRNRGGFFLLLASIFVASITAPAAEQKDKLTGLKTSVDAQSTTITLRLPSTVDYTPSKVGPKLYLLDLAGVATELSADTQPLSSSLVKSYRVFSYQGVDDKPHVGVELSLKEEVDIQQRRVTDGLQVQIRRAGAPMVATVPKAAEPVASKMAPAAATPQNSSPAVLREVSVVQPESGLGLEVEIVGEGEMSYKTLKLSNPDRLVLDLSNTLNRIKQSELAVGSAPLKTVRIAQYKSNPPVARIVMDLESKISFNVRKESTGLVVALNSTDELSAQQATPKAVIMLERTVASADSKTANVTTTTAVIAEDAATKAPFLIASNNGAGVGAGSAPVQAAKAPLAWTSAPSAPATSSSAVLASKEIAPVKAIESAVPSSSVPAKREQVPMIVPTAAKFAVQPVLMAQSAVQPAGVPAAPARTGNALPQYTGEPISLNLKDVDLKDFFRLMHEVSNLNIVLDPAVSGSVTIVLDEVPWDQAMDIVLRNNQLGKEVAGNVVRIAKLSTIEAEKRQEEALAKASEQAEPAITVTRTLSYAKAANLITPLKRFLTARGDLVADPRTNTLIITDIQDAITRVDGLIRGLDLKTQQVEIEARIVAASRSFARDIGTQLAASGLSGNVVLGGAGIVGTSPINRGTTPPLFIGTPPEPPAPGEAPTFANVAQPLSVNLGAVGATSGFSFLLTSGSRFALDAIITSAEDRGLGKLLSRPKIITQNNVEAKVEQGVKVPIQTNVNNTISVQFINATLRLTVTPQITADGTVFLKAEIENTSINDGVPRILGIPALNTQLASTEVLVSDGGTVFFGGIIQTSNTLTQQEVPLLGSIPLVGNLFKRKFTRTSTDELLFFITPKIVQS